LGNFIVRLRLDGVYDIGKLDGILDEENGDIIANNIPVPLGCVELNSKSSYITHSVSTTARSLDGAEAYEYGSCPRRISEHSRGCKLGRAVVIDLRA